MLYIKKGIIVGSANVKDIKRLGLIKASMVYDDDMERLR